MPVYNTAEYLREAVDSIIGQTLSDFEFLIIDDGSTDGSAEILDDYEKSDDRIRVFHQENRGLAVSLNRGLRAAGGKYIARMDSDDISLPERFAKQVAFMDRHPEVGLCGTAFMQFGERTGASWTMTDPEEIKSRLMFWPCFGHPTVMMRRELVVRENLYYDTEFKQSEDHELWVRFSRHCKITNLTEVLLLYRTDAGQATNIYRDDVVRWSGRIHRQAIGALGIEMSDEESMIHESLHTSTFEVSRDYVNRVEEWLCKLMDANEIHKVYESNALAGVLYERWHYVCSNAVSLGLWVCVKFRKSRLFEAGRWAGCNPFIPFGWRSFVRPIYKRLAGSDGSRYMKRIMQHFPRL
jgi:glycosyltransferase involved in cell wall biosynthesis